MLQLRVGLEICLLIHQSKLILVAGLPLIVEPTRYQQAAVFLLLALSAKFGLQGVPPFLMHLSLSHPGFSYKGFVSTFLHPIHSFVISKGYCRYNLEASVSASFVAVDSSSEDILPFFSGGEGSASSVIRFRGGLEPEDFMSAIGAEADNIFSAPSRSSSPDWTSLMTCWRVSWATVGGSDAGKIL